MERKNYFVTVILILILPIQAMANWKTLIYEAYISNNMPGWKVTIDKMNLEKNQSNGDFGDFLSKRLQNTSPWWN